MALIDEIADAFPAYRLDGGGVVRYFVHGRSAECKGCGSLITPSSTIVAKSCSTCGGRVRFTRLDENATVLLAAEVDPYGTIDRQHARWGEVERLWGDLNAAGLQRRTSRYDAELVENRRTLTRAGSRVSAYFTPFAFSVLSAFAHAIEQLEDSPVRDALQLVLTGASAQASRLIPYRNNMKTGGPAWSIPGFWVPPVHLECNVFERLRTRLVKVARAAAEAVAHNTGAGSVSVYQSDASNAAAIVAPLKPDVVFLDPPYAGDIPYLEFSAIWNAFIAPDSVARYDQEIVVSDRTAPRSSWDDYRRHMDRALNSILDCVPPEGVVVLTFNNLNAQSWQAVLGPLQRRGFRVEHVSYQEPAVKSSKSQFAPDSSYLGDFYIDLRKLDGAVLAADGEAVAETAVRTFFTLRGMRAQPLTRIRSVALRALLAHNVVASEYLALDTVLSRLCDLTPTHGMPKWSCSASEDAYADYLKSLVTDALRSLGLAAPDDEIALSAMKADGGRGMPEFREVDRMLSQLRSESQLSLLA